MIKKTNELALNGMKKIIKEFNDDKIGEESLHVGLDRILIYILKREGYKELAEEYTKQSEYFWYA